MGSCIVSKGMRSLALRTVTCNDALGVRFFVWVYGKGLYAFCTLRIDPDKMFKSWPSSF